MRYGRRSADELRGYQLAGGRVHHAASGRFLSFDTTAKALAAAEGFPVFPPLDAAGKQTLARLKH